MGSDDSRKAIVQSLEQEIARCRRILGMFPDKLTRDRLIAYLRELEYARAKEGGRNGQPTLGDNETIDNQRERC